MAKDRTKDLKLVMAGEVYRLYQTHKRAELKDGFYTRAIWMCEGIVTAYREAISIHCEYCEWEDVTEFKFQLVGHYDRLLQIQRTVENEET